MMTTAHADYETSLALPQGKCDLILDTDTYNEIDDQFALTYALLASDCITLHGVTAAPFHNDRSDSPGDGMEKSYEEILRVMKLSGFEGACPVYRGSTEYLPDGKTPVHSDAADFIVEKALEFGRQGKRLYVAAIGAITNVASAILICPDIIEHITVVWLGGNPHYWTPNHEFNLYQDVPGAQVLFDSGVPLVQIPCVNVAQHLTTTSPELAVHIKDRGQIGRYLYDIFDDYISERGSMSKVVWDISAIAFFTIGEAMASELVSSPVLEDDAGWTATTDRHPIRVVTSLSRDRIFKDLFDRLPAAAGA
jgi:inosine-uridine nucleoside N-ribohydrolase